MLHDAFEIRPGSSDAPILVTCEHATQRMPDGYAWPAADRRLVDTHWAYDLGALELASELAGSFSAREVSSRFSRLLIDPNRPEDSPTLFRADAEGGPVALNQDVSKTERARRIEGLWRPYHAAVDRLVADSRAPILVSMHTFTRFYEGAWRDLEIGVLFDRDEALAEQIAEALSRAGLQVALNEPYSGKGGLMYAVDRHARVHGRRCVEFEVRQDLATYRGFRAELGPLLRDVLLTVSSD
ncbi:MAG: N-formylglutamate amidohydrolase [Sandaracinaceae bacterium]